jgi:hypothetical protein
MRVTLLMLLLAAAAHAQGADCCDDPRQPCCDNSPQPAPPYPVILVPAPPMYPQVLAPPPRKPSENRLLMQLTAGAAYQLVLDESIGGFAGEVMLGAEDNHWGGGAQTGIMAGRTEKGGLTYYWFRFGPGFEFHLGPWMRLGFGLTLGTLQIQRADHSGWMGSPSFGGHVDFSVDLAKGSRGNALFATMRLGGDALLEVTDLEPGSLHLSAGLGYRM